MEKIMGQLGTKTVLVGLVIYTIVLIHLEC